MKEMEEKVKNLIKYYKILEKGKDSEIERKKKEVMDIRDLLRNSNKDRFSDIDYCEKVIELSALKDSKITITGIIVKLHELIENLTR